MQVRAEQLLTSLVAETPHDEYALNNLGALYGDASPAAVAAGLHQPERALPVLRRVLHLQPTSPQACVC